MEDNSEGKFEEEKSLEIQDSPDAESAPKKRRRGFFLELVLFFVLGVLMGVAFKTEAVKKISIGFDDYRMKIVSQDYDITQIRQDLLEKQLEKQRAATESSVPSEGQGGEDKSLPEDGTEEESGS